MGQSASAAEPLQSCTTNIALCDPNTDTIKVDFDGLAGGYAGQLQPEVMASLPVSKSLRDALRDRKASSEPGEPDRGMLAKAQWEQQLRRELEEQAARAAQQQLAEQQQSQGEDDERKRALELIRREMEEGQLREKSPVARMSNLSKVSEGEEEEEEEDEPGDKPSYCVEPPGKEEEEDKEGEEAVATEGCSQLEVAPVPAGGALIHKPAAEAPGASNADHAEAPDSAADEEEAPDAAGPAELNEEEAEAQRRVESFLAEHRFRGVNAKKRQQLFWTTYPLHVASARGDATMVELLLARGANSEQRDSSGRTAAQVAQKLCKNESHQKVLQALGVAR